MPRSSLSSRARLAVLPWLPKARVGLLLSPPSLSPSTPRATTLQTTLHLLRCPSASCCLVVPMCGVSYRRRCPRFRSLLGGGFDDAPSAHRLGKFVQKKIAKKIGLRGGNFLAVNSTKESWGTQHATSNLTFEQHDFNKPTSSFFSGPGVVDKKSEAVGVWFRERTEEKAAQQLGLSPRDTQGRQAFTDRVERRTDHER